MYCNTENFNSAQEKLDFLGKTKFDCFAFEHIKPDHQNNWIDLTDNDFDDLISIADKKNKSIFEVCSNGVATNRDEWVYDTDLENLENKSIFFIDEYNYEVQRWIQYKKDNKYQDIKQESNPVLDKFLSE
ncbi:MAG: type ISP restriction/modification enzyme, partial [Dolichospermum sp.]